jgi:hypothetical protein
MDAMSTLERFEAWSKTAAVPVDYADYVDRLGGLAHIIETERQRAWQACEAEARRNDEELARRFGDPWNGGSVTWCGECGHPMNVVRAGKVQCEYCAAVKVAEEVIAQRDALRKLVEEQANDEALWFVHRTASEAYLQKELRRLHASIEAASAAQSVERGGQHCERCSVLGELERLREKAQAVVDMRRRDDPLDMHEALNALAAALADGKGE